MYAKARNVAGAFSLYGQLSDKLSDCLGDSVTNSTQMRFFGTHNRPQKTFGPFGSRISVVAKVGPSQDRRRWTKLRERLSASAAKPSPNNPC